MSNLNLESTREKIFGILKTKGQMTVADLSGALGITHISIRHHLSSLQNEKLVEAREERHGVGRPRLVYRLTATGMERNSTTYLKLTNLLLHQLKEQLPPPVVERILLDMASHMAGELRARVAGLPLEERIETLIALLIPEGFLARVEPLGSNQYCLTELVCPYATISLQHPEVCVLDASMLSSALGAKVERRTCILSGSDSCTFTIMDSTTEGK